MMISRFSRYIRDVPGMLFQKNLMVSNVICHARLSSSPEKLTFDLDSKTGIVTLEMNSPPVNSLGYEMLKSTTEAIKFVENERDIRGAIIKSKFNGKVFSAGLDIIDFYQKPQSELFDFWTYVQDWYIAWYGCKKPTAAVINGHAPGGGCALALMCDYRVMQSGAGKMIGLNEARVGVSAVLFFFIELMISTIGQRPSEAALLSGKLYSAEEAKDIGLVDQIDDLNNLESIATKQLLKLVSVPPAAYSLTKRVLRQDVINRLIKVKREDAESFAIHISQPKVQEAIGQYLRNMKPGKT